MASNELESGLSAPHQQQFEQLPTDIPLEVVESMVSAGWVISLPPEYASDAPVIDGTKITDVYCFGHNMETHFLHLGDIKPPVAGFLLRRVFIVDDRRWKRHSLEKID